MDGYKKPIINPYNQYRQAPKKPVQENTVQTVTKIEVSDKVEPKEAVFMGPIITEPVDATNASNEDTLNAVVEAAAENAEQNEDIEKIRDLQHKEYEDRDLNDLTPDDAIEDNSLPEGVVAAERSFPTDASGKPMFHMEDRDPVPAADLDILHVDDLDQFNEDNFKKNFVETTAKNHQLSDEDAMTLLDIMTAYKKDKTISVFNRMPDSIKTQVRQICMSANIPMTNANQVAKMMLDELIAETATDQTFIDFEKSINEAMKIPSLVDMYEEHVAETVGEKLPAMADAIKDEDPAKAKMLLDVADQYEAARTYSKLKECFDTNSRVRKLVRRDADRWHRFGEELNFMNKDSKFRMPDACSLHPILLKVIANDPDNDLTEENVNKFLVLLYRSCSNLHKDELVDASYIYYLLKNISMLNYVNDHSSKAADTFSVELISNIKAMMYYIMAKEEEFYASNKSSGSRK